MKILSEKEFEQMKEALRLSIIYMQEHPFDDSPIRKARESLDILVNGEQVDNRFQQLEDLLREVLGEITDESGAMLPPSPTLVEKVNKVLDRN